MRRIQLSEHVERHFPKPGSNRGFRASEIVNTFVLLLNEGARCLEDVRHLRREKALFKVL